jgi:hypothetical protein
MRAAAAVATAALALLAAPAPALAASERMQLTCQDGRVIERTNGSSWFGVDHDAGYVSEHLLITEDDEVVHEQDYGRKGPGRRSTCVADHFGTQWTVDLFRTR